MGRDLNKSLGIITVYEELVSGGNVKKSEMAQELGVNPKTVYRYIEDLRRHFENKDIPMRIVSNRKSGYYIEPWEKEEHLCSMDIAAISKVLIESRGFSKEEINNIVKKLLRGCRKEEKKRIMEIIGNELYNYVQPMHSENLIKKIWDMSCAVRDQNLIKMEYVKIGENGKLSETAKTRVVEPQGVLFSEYYFYLAACIQGKEYHCPTIFRIDRIKGYEILDECFEISYKGRFQEGEFRKLIQFMHTGDILNVKFRYTGSSLEAVLDRLPTAQVISDNDGEYVIRAKVFGKGVKMWLLSQGDSVEVLEPKEFRDEMREVAWNMARIYGHGDSDTSFACSDGMFAGTGQDS